MNLSEPLIFVIDDDASVRRGLERLLKSAQFAVETFPSSEAFLKRETHSGPSCLVLDIRMPNGSGLELQDSLHKRDSHPPIVFLTGHADVPTSVSAMKKGAHDFLTKPVDDSVLLDAVKKALARDKEANLIRKQRDELRDRINTLTPREYDVYRLVVTGMLNKQVGSEFGIGEKTVKVHCGRVMQKMKVESLAELVRTADRAGVS